MRLRCFARSAFALIASSSIAVAYNPPVDTAGPLTARMLRPAAGAYGAGGYVSLSRPGVPFTIPVMIDNDGDVALKGTIRVAVVDDWRVEPAAAVPFELGPRKHSRHDFRVSFGAKTYNAHYPVHAYVEFEHGGKRLTAHPVLILETEIPDLGRPALPVEWKPVPAPKGSTLGLWRLPVRRESAESVKTGADTGTVGRETWQSTSVFQYGPLSREGGVQEGIGMILGRRPPSGRETISGATVEYPLALPDAEPLRLDFSVAGRARFDVLVLPFEGGDGVSAFESTRNSDEWQKASADLSKYRGQNVRVRLTASGGTGEVWWAEPTLQAGTPPAAARPGGGGKALGTAAGCQVRVMPGQRGLLDAPVEFACGERRLTMNGFRVRVTGDALEDARAATGLVSVAEEPAAGRHRVRHRFRNWAGDFDVLIELWVERDALRSRVWMENAPPPQPWFRVTLESVGAGSWSEPLQRVYGGPGNVIEKPEAFRLGFDGHNLATSYVGFDFANGFALVQHSDTVPDALQVDPRTRFASLVGPHAQTLSFFPAESVWAGVKRIREQDTRKASAGVPKLAGRFTFDLWSGRYAESARELERPMRYGLTDSLVVWHNWQRSGYDYRLPDIYPPNPEFGTFEEFRELVETCRKHGVLFAPHDNYIDFYPDFEGFSYGSVVFRPNGQPYKAWFNYGRGAQSYRARPDTLKPYVERNVKLIKEGFAPTAYFIDVWSSISPYDYWTEDGQFFTRDITQRVWGESFAWIRSHLGDNAPQISEAGHDKLIGWLDGADAQQLRVQAGGASFTWNIRCADSERIPWIDFAWHDKFVLHGAGYPGRYEGGLDREKHGIYSDDYMATEVLSGRPAMVSEAFSRDVVRKYWLLSGTMRALALDRIDQVEFAGGDIHRQHVKWEGGGEAWVNRGSADWSVAGHVLPQYGFYVRAPKGGGVHESAVERIGGNVVEWSRSPEMLYVNGRGQQTDFGGISTDSAVRLTREELTPLPDSKAGVAQVRWSKLPWKSARPARLEAVPESGGSGGGATVIQGDDVRINVQPGVFTYRLVPQR